MPKNTAPKGLPALFQPIDLTEGPCWKTILRFSFPIILSYLLQQVYSISDAAIVGQTLSAEEVAGVNDIAPIVNIFLQFAFGVSAGFCVITSCNVGSHNQPGVRRSLATQIVLSAVLTLLLTALALALLNPMLAWINVTPDSGAVYTAAFTYCAIIFAGIGAQLFYNFICSFLRAMGDSVTPLMFLLFSTVLNVGLDLLFILSFGWGVAGAAIATVLAQLISTVACFLYAFSRYPELRLHREDFAITKSDLSQHIAQGVPLGLQFSVLSVGIITMQSVVVQFDMQAGLIVSNAAQNGFGAANKLHMLTMTPLNAFGTALTSFTAQNLGAGKHERIRRGAIQASIIMALLAALSAGAGLLMTIGDTYFHVFLSADKVTPETIRYGNAFLYVDYAMYLLLGGIFLIAVHSGRRRGGAGSKNRGQLYAPGSHCRRRCERVRTLPCLLCALRGRSCSVAGNRYHPCHSVHQKHSPAGLPVSLRRASPPQGRKSVVSIRTGGLMKQPSFFQRVYSLVRQIPAGACASYSQLAYLLGAPRAARQVGWAMRTCPDDLPWQRVVKADGSIAGGGYADLRRALLEAEGVPFLPDGRVDLRACQWQGPKAV